MAGKKVSTWERDDVQFPRLLAEIHATVEFSDDQWADLQASTDLDVDQLVELFERADVVWQGIKDATRNGRYPTDGYTAGAAVQGRRIRSGVESPVFLAYIHDPSGEAIARAAGDTRAQATERAYRIVSALNGAAAWPGADDMVETLCDGFLPNLDGTVRRAIAASLRVAYQAGRASR